VLVTTGSGVSGYVPSHYWEYDPTTTGGGSFTQVPPPPATGFIPVFLALPNGQVLTTTQSATQAYVYTPTGGPQDAWRPAVTSVGPVSLGHVVVHGTQLNGLTNGASFGDDFDMETSFPVVWLVDASGNVTFGRTFQFDQMAPRLGAAGSFELALPNTLADGSYSMHVSASGVEAAPTPIQLGIRAASLGGTPCVDAFSSQVWTATISAPAPASGVVVDLSSSQPTVASTQATLTVPAGATSANFLVRCHDAGFVTLYATAETNIAQTVSKSFGPKVVRLTGSAAIPIGASATWQVGVFPGAPSSGFSVQLSSSDPTVATVPATVAVGPLSSVATFPVTVVGPGEAVVTASMPGSSQSGGVGYAVTSVSGPSAPTSGNVATWTVSINSTYGSPGVPVNLRSTNTLAASVPATVTIANGNSATFPVTSPGPGQALIIASVEGSSAQAGFGLDVASLSLASPTISGIGNSTTATVALTGAAAAGGFVVDIQALTNIVTVPSSVTVAAGATTATFPVTAAAAPGTGRIVVRAHGVGNTGSSKAVLVSTAL
jgi:hypothetical protein